MAAPCSASRCPSHAERRKPVMHLCDRVADAILQSILDGCASLKRKQPCHGGLLGWLPLCHADLLRRQSAKHSIGSMRTAQARRPLAFAVSPAQAWAGCKAGRLCAVKPCRGGRVHGSAGIRLERRTCGVCEWHGLSWGGSPGWQPVHTRTVQQLPHLPRFVQCAACLQTCILESSYGIR